VVNYQEYIDEARDTIHTFLEDECTLVSILYKSAIRGASPLEEHVFSI
jgi:hypothetical protein